MNNSEDLRAYPKNSGNSVNTTHISCIQWVESKEKTLTKYETKNLNEICGFIPHFGR